ncbi:MAG: cyclic nucleotide-binding domain-containing protein [Chloroflexi bacterium]|nr:cyclic nucleotide-binding domain-containing protein [Chloroflexota bacterium]
MIKSIDLLQQNELFGSLTGVELSMLAPLCSDFVAIEDSVVFTEGRMASHLYIIKEGKIALQRAIRVPHGRNSRRTTVTLCYPGEIVGWSALAEPYKYTMSAVAWETSRLISIDSKMLRNALDTDIETGYKVMKSLSVIMSRRLKHTTESLIGELERFLAGARVYS